MSLDPYRTPEPSTEGASFPVAPAQNPFSKTMQIVMSHAIVFIGCYTVIWFPLDLASSYIDQHYIDEDDFITSMNLYNLLGVLIGTISTGAVLHTALDVHAGRQPTIASSLRGGISSWPRLVSTYISYAILSTLGIFLLLLPGLYVMVRSIYCDVIAVAERKGGMAAIRRSFDTTEGQFLRTLSAALVISALYICTIIPYMGILLPLSMTTDMMESQYAWVIDAVLSLSFGIPSVFSQVLLSCMFIEYASSQSSSDSVDDSSAEPPVHETNEAPLS